MYNIEYSINHFTISFLRKAHMKAVKESAIRGIIGQQFLKNYCIKDNNCEQCGFRDICTAARFFGSKLKYELPFLASHYVPAFIIICDNNKTEFDENEELKFSIITFSNGITLIPNIIQALIEQGRTIGINNNKFILKSVENDRNKYVYNEREFQIKNVNVRHVEEYVENRLSISDDISMIKIVKPLRFKKNGKFTSDINEEDIINLLSRRILTLNALQGNESGKSLDYYLKIKNVNIRWNENKRYSNRQKTSMNFGGIIGEIYIEVSDLETKKLLICGELVHIGKNTSFGYGDYILY